MPNQELRSLRRGPAAARLDPLRTALGLEPHDDRWAAARQLLEQQRADCVHRRALALAEAATSVPDPVATSRAARLALGIEEIDAALDRIADGSYGRCTQCGVAIPAERLRFRPSAAGCVGCQTSVR